MFPTWWWWWLQYYLSGSSSSSSDDDDYEGELNNYIDDDDDLLGAALLEASGSGGVRPVRDACHLMADLEADPRFSIHTSVFLSNGAGGDYRGGVSLYGK